MGWAGADVVICKGLKRKAGGIMNRNFGADGANGLVAAGAGMAESRNGVSSLLRSAGIVLAGSALVAICAHVSIPLWFTPVPVTLQPFAVMLLGLLLGPQLALGATLAYLAEGAAGLPFFSPHGLGGIAQLLGPTGGYLFSYPIVAPLVSVLFRLWRRRSFSQGLVAAGAGNLVTLAMGAVWLGVVTHAAPMIVLSDAVLPFLPGDVLMVCAAAGIAAGASRFRRQEI
jgi:biotin transport system substrate-specific component